MNALDENDEQRGRAERRKVIVAAKAFLANKAGVIQTVRAICRFRDLADTDDRLREPFASLYAIDCQSDHLPLTREQQQLWSDEMQERDRATIAHWESDEHREEVSVACRQLLAVLKHTPRSRIMYIEDKSAGLVGPARIGRVTFSKTGNTLYYGGRAFQRTTYGFKVNYFEVGTGALFWISGPRTDGADGLYGYRPTPIDDDVREEYWRTIRRQPSQSDKTVT